MHSVVEEVKNCVDEGIKPDHDKILKDASKHVKKLAAKIDKGESSEHHKDHDKKSTGHHHGGDKHKDKHSSTTSDKKPAAKSHITKSKHLTPGPHKVHKYAPGSVAVPKSGRQITDRHKLKAFKGPKPTHHAQIFHESEDENNNTLNYQAQTWAEKSDAKDNKKGDKDKDKDKKKPKAKKPEGKKESEKKDDDSKSKKIEELAK